MLLLRAETSIRLLLLGGMLLLILLLLLLLIIGNNRIVQLLNARRVITRDLQLWKLLLQLLLLLLLALEVGVSVWGIGHIAMNLMNYGSYAIISPI